jgi:lipopolysaccharide transport system permease protein
MRFELTRDADGRPVAIRIRFDAESLRLVARRLRPRLPRLPRLLMWPASAVRALGGALRRSIPRIRVRRDADGRLQAIVLAFGTPAEAAPAVSVREPFRARVREFARTWSGTVSPYLPQATLVTDSRGHPASIRVSLGAVEAPPAELVVSKKALKWIIEPVGSGVFTQLQEFWRYRRMLWFLSVRGVKRLYVGMNLGIFWLFVRPLLPIAISTLIFGRLLNVPSDGVPYFLFFLAGSTSWMLFEQSAMWATRSLDLNKGLIKKVYFPRLIVPLSSVAPAVVQAGVYGALLFASVVYYFVRDGRWYLRLGPELFVALLAAGLSVLFAVAVGLWTTIWQVKFREVRYTLRYVMRFWNYLTPVLYPLSQVPEKYHWIVFLNPMAPLVEAFKWGVLGIGELNFTATMSGLGVIVLTLFGGIWYFNRSEATSVDKL